MTVLQSMTEFTNGDQWNAIADCSDAFRADPQNPEAAVWYEGLKYSMKCLSDSGKVPLNVLSAFDTSEAFYTAPQR